MKQEGRNKFLEIESKQKILGRRKEIEQEPVEMLKETRSDFTLEHVRDVIYHEENNDDMIHPIGYDKLSNGVKAVAMFDPSSRTQGVPYGAGRGGDALELNNVLELVTDAWNYFPHKVPGGISPAEVLLGHHNKSKK